MRLTLLLIAAFFIFYTAVAQNDFSYQNELTPVVTGQLLGYDPAVDTSLTLTFSCVVPTPERQEKHIIEPEQDGSFEFTVKYPLRYQQIWFGIGKYYYGQLLVDKGLTIKANLDSLREKRGQFFSDQVHFSGPDGEMTRLVNQYTSYEIPLRPENNPKIELIMDRAMPPAEKVKRLRSIYADQEAIEKEFLKEHPSSYAWILENERLSDLYAELFIIHLRKEMPGALYQEAIEHQPRLISNSGLMSYCGYLSYFLLALNDQERHDFFKEQLLPTVESPEERARLQNFLEIFDKKQKDLSYDEALFKEESSYFIRQYKEELLRARIDAFVEKVSRISPEKADMVRLVGGGEDIWEREPYVEAVLPTIQNSVYTGIMREDWEANRERIRKAEERLKAIRVVEKNSPMGESLGTLPNGAELIIAGQEDVESLLGAIRGAFPGKAILLDIWATWCAPCIYDMENSAGNIEKLRAMDVEVVYLCTSSGVSQEAWRKKAAELNLNTKHIYLNPELSKAIMSYFDLEGYPSHIFLDKEGQHHPDLVHGIRNVNLEALREKL